ncbi:rab11 family-interacting protein 1-like isoform X1 [Motacilla alba alba]|uniref:rab11 family-interacting protein 1-like isoform X1 n=1 Tax=Motacilla alba alba TaxID=1094192 RepID=UPI0018D5A14F|nr:rab11 family-interacting protein 1-like isoform X1 [Motacilla alba alba]XP_038016138.1 rab11 family-interacting protein 1-like isoform X1 [Motacilla alba alba]XP_038016139.1 rab11 family-interacting protein 1-like isoform X1 [Motacilla alba alba]
MAGAAPGWAPTHVRVTVLRARGLRAKAAAGGSDAYAVMALGRDKFRTSVAERCRGEPLWREEATFELPARPAALRLTVLHRALAGADKFLGRAEVELAALRDGGGRQHTRWYKLRSKPGKKEKERGEIEVDIQFMRSNMTASMFDLSMKDKPRSPFGKLKDKLKGKRSSGLSDTASAIVPSTSHSPADSEDEAVEKEKKKSKFKALFSKPGLQKTSLSQSMSVLPTQQPLTQRVRLRPSDFQAQWDEEESETSPASERSFESVPEQKPAPSPLFKSRKPAFLDSRQLTQGTTNHTKKDGLSLFSGLKSKSDPVSKSSLCINGSHVYMEETTTKDKTPTSSPSPHNLRRKQLFASEENLSSRSTKSPEEMGRTSPGQAFSGSTSLETFKSMTLPSYKLLSSEEHLDTSVPPSVEPVRETKKPDHKKSALLSLVTGKKETAKPSDAEIIPDRTLQSEENTILEEKSEEEAKCPEAPADVGRGSPSGDAHHAEEAATTKQLLSPCEEERKPEKAAPAKTKAVKPRLGLSPEEEPKATLPTLAPDPLPAFLSVHRISSANNPFISELGQTVQVPDSENTTSSPASLTSPAFAAELWNDKNPFTPEWDRASRALHPDSMAHFPSSHHPAASVPKVPLPGQLSARGNNPFAAGWGQGPEGSEASQGLSGPCTPSVPSDCPFKDNNPFVSKRGGQAVPASQDGSSPSCLPGGEDCSSAGRPAPGASGGSADVALTSDVTAVPDPLGALSDPPAGPPGLAPEPHWDSARLQPEGSLESSKPGCGKSVSFVLGEWQGVPSGDAGLGGQEGGEQPPDSSGRLQMSSAGERAGFGGELGAGGDPSTELSGDSTHPTWSTDGTAVEVSGVSTEPCTRGDKGSVSLSKCSDSLVPEAERAQSPKSELREEQESCAGKQWAECVPMLEPQAPPPAGNEPLSQVQPTPRACTVSPGEGDPGRAGSEVLVPPKPAPRLAVLLRKSPASPQAELRGDAPASGDGAKSTPGLPFPEASAARGCLPQGGSLETVTPAVTPRGRSSGRPGEKEGGADLSVSLTSVRCAVPVPGDRGSALPGLPVIPEGGSDDELLGDCQDSCGATAGDRGVLENGEQPRGLTPLPGEQRELSDSSAAAPVIPAAPGGGAGAIPGAREPGSLAVLPAAVGAPRVCVQAAGSGLGVIPHSRECDSHFEKPELERGAGAAERAECDFSEPSAFSSSLSSPRQPHSSSHSLLSDTPSRRAESPKKPRAEGFADKAGNSGKKKLLQARVPPSETFPNQTPRGAETVSPKHRLHPVKPMNAMANKPQSKNLNVISTMNEKLLEMSVKKYDPSDPAYAYAQLTHDELIQLVLKQKDTITRKDLQVRELEDYIDNLLVRVMEETPNILRVSMSGNKKAGKM